MAKKRKKNKNKFQNQLAEEYLLIDGYNIIHSWEDLCEIATENLEEARDKFLDIISNYKGFIKSEVIVIFDAYKVKNNRGNVYKHRNITVVYTKEMETADHYIEKITKDLTAGELIKEYSVKVATGDYLEQTIIMGAGAIRVTPRELKVSIEDAKAKVKKTIDERKPAKSNMLIDNLDPKIAEIFDRMRYD